ncbi:hypothetical protein FQN54_003136 [Arachnomyces sp. PD_36]|nr:hypothetical protein FQN54_003136 [Arachnomyces sp. PD_36]
MEDDLSPDCARTPTKSFSRGNTPIDLKTPEARYYEADGSSSLSSSTVSSAPTSPEITYTSFPLPSSEFTAFALGPCDEDDDLGLPSFDGEDYFSQGKELDPPTSVVSDTQPTSSPETPTFQEQQEIDQSNIPKTAGDDNSIEIEPTSQVDYLSHEWKEEEVWASWRYVTSKKERFRDAVRLENASWRAWSKYKNNLKIVTPESLRWRKDVDVTWLYGPLQTCPKKCPSRDSRSPPSRISTSNSFLKKPILKKKSASEAILQRSLSTHTLLKHASAIVRAQELRGSKNRAPLERSVSDFAVPLVRHGIDSSTIPTDTTPSGIVSPSGKRRIHFNDEVSQCIAVEAKDCEEGDHNDDPQLSDDNEISDDGLVTMKGLPSRTPISSQTTPRDRSPNGSRTIAPLPPTTLKCREPEPKAHSFWSLASNLSSSISSNVSLGAPRLASNILSTQTPNASSSTPQPPPSTTSSAPTLGSGDNFSLSDDDYDDYDNHNNNQFRFNFTWNLPQTSQVPPQGGAWFSNPRDEAEEEEEDGLYFPPPAVDSGLLDRVADTVNTARDIAHVIWNVGWRR